MKKKFNLRTKLTISITLILLLFLVVVIFIIRSYVLKEIQADMVETIYAEQTEMDTGTTYLINQISPIHANLHSSLEREDLTNKTISELTEIYQRIMRNLIYDQEIFGQILLVNNQHILGVDSQIPFSTNINPQFIDDIFNDEKIIIEGPIITLNDIQYLLIGKKIQNSENTGIIYPLKISRIQTILNINPQNNIRTMILSGNKIIASNEISTIGNIIYDLTPFEFEKNNYQVTTFQNERVIIIGYDGNKNHNQYDLLWKYVSIVDYNILAKDINSLNRNVTIITLISTLISIIMAYILSAGLVKPIRNLSMKMKNYREGDQGIASKTSGDEIIELERSFNEMIERITTLIHENALQSENKRKLELYALQMQINPHFLYNTLDAIAWLAKLKKQPEIEQLVMALAQFFRISLHKGDKFIKVEEEIELIKNYIAIEQIRFPNKFTVHYEIDDDVKNYESMKLILQPLVENAIKHGISELEENGQIIVKAYQNQEYIYYEVIDNGFGFDPNQPNYNPHLMSGYGCKNVDERIKLEYGADSGLVIETQKNKGTKVIVKFRKR